MLIPFLACYTSRYGQCYHVSKIHIASICRVYVLDSEDKYSMYLRNVGNIIHIHKVHQPKIGITINNWSPGKYRISKYINIAYVMANLQNRVCSMDVLQFIIPFGL
jgi:hypothetical protein